MKALIQLIVLGLGLVAGAEAQAMKCEGRTDCDYRVYTTSNGVMLYASNCQRSDDQGSQLFDYSALTVFANGTAILDTGAEHIPLVCTK